MILLIVIVAIVIVAQSVILRGMVLSTLWGWYAVPIFGLHPLNLAQAIGVCVVVHLLTHQYVPARDKDVWGPLANLYLMPLSLLLVGWIAKPYI